MSKWDKFIIVAAVIALALFLYVLASEQMSASFVSATVIPASDMPEKYNEIARLMSNGSLSEIQFSKMTSDDVKDYYFVNYTLSLSNSCPIPAKWATMSMLPAVGDIVCMQSNPATIPPFVTGAVTGTLLTTDPDQPRSGWIEYYVLGRMMTAKVEMGR